MFTDVPGVVDVQVAAPIGSSDHSALLLTLTLQQDVPEFSIRREVFLKNRINWDAVREDVS